MSIRYYRLYCENCSYNRITDGTDIDDLFEYKRSKIATSIPKIDPITKKVITKDPKALPKQFRCPKCGRLITPKKIPDPPKEENENLDSRS